MNRFFENNEGNELPISQIKDNLKQLASNDLKSRLSKTDWQIVRANDPTSGKEISQLVMDERQSARDIHASIEAQIDAAQNIETLKSIYKANL